MRILITGITGFVGSHLAQYLSDQHFEVWGITKTNRKLDNIRPFQDRLHLLTGDLRDRSTCDTLIKEDSLEKTPCGGFQSIQNTSTAQYVVVCDIGDATCCMFGVVHLYYFSP